MFSSVDLNARPLKRTRLPADNSGDSKTLGYSSTSSSNLLRHHEIWFDDGNIVLIARETAFRIYRGLLAGQSTVFTDLFASSASSPDETFEGCPVIHLSDSPYDLAHLLRVLLPQSRIHYHPTTAIPVRTVTFDEVSAVIRLAHKYNVQQVQDQGLSSLQKCAFVNSFAAFSHLPPEPQIALVPAHSIGVVNLARLTDTPSLLPIALYNCAHRGSALFDGWTHEDGTVEYLSEADLRRCFDALRVLTNERTLFMCRLFNDTVGSGCQQPERCSTELRRLHRNVLCSEVLSHRAHVLMDWREPIELNGEDGVLCTACTEELLKRNESERKKIFNRLPEIFNIQIEGWGAETEAGAGLAQGN